MLKEKRIVSYGDAVRFLKDAKVKETGAFSKGINKGLNIAISALGNKEILPYLDVVEVVHGHWCWEGKFKACSECGSYVEWDETLGANFWKFCPYCGAKMDGDA